MSKKIIYMGTPDFAVPALKALIREGYTLTAVVTQPDKPRGRSGTLQPPPVKEAALEAAIPVWQPSRLRDPGFIDQIAGAKPDLIVVAAYGKIIPDEILSIPPFGCINIHASLLPAYRGAAPIQHAVINGEKESGVTIMQMDSGLDTGDMLAKTVIPLALDETGGSLFDKLAAAGADLLISVLPELFAGELKGEKQPAVSPTPYAGMITKQMGLIDFSRPAVELERLVRGLNPWPCAYTFLGEKILRIWRAEIAREEPESCPGSAGSGENSPAAARTGADPDALPGTVTDTGRDGIRVACGDGSLLLTEVQLEGKKRMPADAFLRGFPLREGTVLGTAADH